MTATLHNLAFVENEYLVGILDGGQAMGYGYSCTALHQTLQSLLYKAFGLCIQSGSSLIQYQYRRILKYGTCYAHPLALATGQASATVSYHRIITVLTFHDEVMRIGNLGRLDDLLHSGILHSEGYVVVESVVEEDSLLIYITDQRTQIAYPHVLHILAVYQYLSAAHIMIPGNQVHKGRLATARLTYQSNGLALRNGQVDMLKHITALLIMETYIAQLHILFKRMEFLRLGKFLDGIVCLQDKVYAVHGCQAMGYLIRCLGQVLQRIYHTVQNHHVEDEGGGIYHVSTIQDEPTAEPQHYHYYSRTQELRHGVSGILPYHHLRHLPAVFVVLLIEAL